MEPELHMKLLGMFYYSLVPGGVVLLGSSESLGVQSHLFNPSNAKLKIFTRSESAVNPEIFDFPSSFSRSKQLPNEHQMPDKSIVNIQTLADNLLLQQFSPAGVLVNENGDIIYISGRTGKYLEPAAGKANLNIFAMLREGLRNEFPVAFRKAIVKKEAIVLHNLKIGTNGTTQTVNVKIQWIGSPEPLKGTVMIVFADTPDISGDNLRSKKGRKSLNSIRETELEDEVHRLREEMQSTIEEMQTSQEELKSTNEELQSTNEEFQSTNEELTTSKEEMQSLNEELQTVNAELQSKVEDYSRVNNDMKNLLNSTDIATLFLDKELNIRRFTIQATKIFKLIKSDVGRPFTDQVSDLVYPDLAEDAIEVLSTLVFKQKQIAAKDGRWFAVRIMPYRTSDDRIDGLVITFINISDVKQEQEKLNESEQVQRLLLASFPGIIIRLSAGFKILEFNPGAAKFFGKKCEDALNQSFIQLFVPEPMHKKTEKELNKHLKEVRDGKLPMKVLTAGGNISDVEWSVNVFHDQMNVPVGMILIAN